MQQITRMVGLRRKGKRRVEHFTERLHCRSATCLVKVQLLFFQSGGGTIGTNNKNGKIVLAIRIRPG
jgi:hypothetical protein